MAKVKKLHKAQSGDSIRTKMLDDMNKAIKNPPTPKQIAAEKARHDSLQKANRPTWLKAVDDTGMEVVTPKNVASSKQKSGGKTYKAKSGAKLKSKSKKK